ncbi:MAG: hypothetical protein ACR2QJ_17390 [Geminicoccaceae bacterium]
MVQEDREQAGFNPLAAHEIPDLAGDLVEVLPRRFNFEPCPCLAHPKPSFHSPFSPQAEAARNSGQTFNQGRHAKRSLDVDDRAVMSDIASNHGSNGMKMRDFS